MAVVGKGCRAEVMRAFLACCSSLVITANKAPGWSLHSTTALVRFNLNLFVFNGAVLRALCRLGTSSVTQLHPDPTVTF